MQNLEKIRSLKNSGRYQCDLYFYTELYSIAEELNLYDYLPSIDDNKLIIEKTKELTKKHLSALEEEDNEEKAVQIIREINKQVSRINTKFINQLFELIEKLNGKGFQARIIALVKKQPYKKIYLEILDRIVNHVHDPHIRLNEMSIIALFMLKNGDKAQNFTIIFSNVIEQGIIQLKKFRDNFQFIKLNPEIQEVQKVQNYIRGTDVLLNTLLKFNEIYKILSGDNRYGLKINSMKKEILGKIGKEKDNDLQKNKNRPHPELKQFLISESPLPSYCSLCLSITLDGDHGSCRNTVKILYSNRQFK